MTWALFSFMTLPSATPSSPSGLPSRRARSAGVSSAKLAIFASLSSSDPFYAGDSARLVEVHSEPLPAHQWFCHQHAVVIVPVILQPVLLDPVFDKAEAGIEAPRGLIVFDYGQFDEFDARAGMIEDGIDQPASYPGSSGSRSDIHPRQHTLMRFLGVRRDVEAGDAEQIAAGGRTVIRPRASRPEGTRFAGGSFPFDVLGALLIRPW